MTADNTGHGLVTTGNRKRIPRYDKCQDDGGECVEEEWVGRTFETLNSPTPVLITENVGTIIRHVFSYVIFFGLGLAVSSYKFASS